MQYTGTVIEFNDISGKGFIRPDGANSRIRFTHDSICCSGYKCLHEGDRVLFKCSSIIGDSTAQEVVLEKPFAAQ